MAKAKIKRTFEDRVAEYANSGLLRQRLKIGKEVSCLVDGSYGTYRTKIVLTPSKFKNPECSCPSEIYWPCKHIVALEETYRRSPNSFLDIDALLAKLASKTSRELSALMRGMILVAPASLQALGIEGFEEDNPEEPE